MKEIKYQMNLTLLDNTVLKAFDSNEDSQKQLKLKFLASDINKQELTTIFNSSNKNNYKSIYKTTPSGRNVCVFNNYIRLISITESLESIALELEKEIVTTRENIEENGSEIFTPITTTTIELIDTPTEFVIVTLGYVSELEQKVDALEYKLNKLLEQQV